MRAFIIDFDGTVTREDVGFSIIKNFASEGWKEIGQLWIDKKIGTIECGERLWNLVKSTDKEIKEYANNFEINPGFKELVDKINDNSYKLIIASDGYSVYINEILKKNGIENLDIFCNDADYNNGWKLSFSNKNEECSICGNCKRKLVEDLKRKDYKVYYIGDGYSDICACIHADVIFAKSHLKRYCEKHEIPYFGFDTFYDVLDHI
ncbi:MtnX-like HAD-IB family phosphatase [Clostridium magnum]|uniref:2-hydroxy-3-keto-5-methylthiopentenyl-1-phosphate phosphatase n=1 Tax=Clostridium magnum DSM 2767 TaxID=1121326 RepID=A0A161YKX5_9CLOT|nr:MtnX-like HAD-IB family phosphatase [Clostridium magnum]KZL91202.1 2-hydroxy-3-keto-5-methylthiopentenyl-1-phosphate phosphatase [Clostridium magnum DSM 2767]SHI17371.1 Haloacid Dehalogenase superfamily, subfamily IB, phosphoserine phosphatase-like/2,3-diketo-5-methylthio-1-phosphopentane phosphatase [Clostridium magnum DSM 2767]